MKQKLSLYLFFLSLNMVFAQGQTHFFKDVVDSRSNVLYLTDAVQLKDLTFKHYFGSTFNGYKGSRLDVIDQNDSLLERFTGANWLTLSSPGYQKNVTQLVPGLGKYPLLQNIDGYYYIDEASKCLDEVSVNLSSSLDAKALLADTVNNLIYFQSTDYIYVMNQNHNLIQTYALDTTGNFNYELSSSMVMMGAYFYLISTNNNDFYIEKLEVKNNQLSLVYRKLILASTSSSASHYMTQYNNKLYFLVKTGMYEITANGTISLVDNFNPGEPFSYIDNGTIKTIVNIASYSSNTNTRHIFHTYNTTTGTTNTSFIDSMSYPIKPLIHKQYQDSLIIGDARLKLPRDGAFVFCMSIKTGDYKWVRSLPYKVGKWGSFHSYPSGNSVISEIGYTEKDGDTLFISETKLDGSFLNNSKRYDPFSTENQAPALKAFGSNYHVAFVSSDSTVTRMMVQNGSAQRVSKTLFANLLMPKVYLGENEDWVAVTHRKNKNKFVEYGDHLGSIKWTLGTTTHEEVLDVKFTKDRLFVLYPDYHQGDTALVCLDLNGTVKYALTKQIGDNTADPDHVQIEHAEKQNELFYLYHHSNGVTVDPFKIKRIKSDGTSVTSGLWYNDNYTTRATMRVAEKGLYTIDIKNENRIFRYFGLSGNYSSKFTLPKAGRAHWISDESFHVHHNELYNLCGEIGSSKEFHIIKTDSLGQMVYDKSFAHPSKVLYPTVTMVDSNGIHVELVYGAHQKQKMLVRFDHNANPLDTVLIPEGPRQPFINGVISHDNRAIFFGQGGGNEFSFCYKNPFIWMHQSPQYQTGGLSIDEEQKITEESLALLYPNPVGQEMMVEIPGSLQDYSYQIINLQGEVLQEGMHHHEETIQVENLESGFYVLTLFGDDRFFSFKFMKK